MIIATDGMKLHEAIYETLRANYFVNDSADLSRHMGRSRCYLSTLRYNGHSPSCEAYKNLRSYMQECLTETQDANLRKCLAHYIQQIEEEVA